MKNNVIVAPSLLAADFTNLGKELNLIKEHGIEYLHFDVMDGHFVPNLSFGLTLLENLKPKYDFVYDVHLMISNPVQTALEYVKKGANIVTFHVETVSVNEGISLIKKLHENGVRVGISLKPNTPVEALLPFLDHVDLVLVMSVEPGFGGQGFLSSALSKISYFAAYRREHSLQYLIEVDGGINNITGQKCIENGADVLVAGSYLFGKEDIKERLERLK